MSGEVCASVELALANANLTEQQFYYCLETLVYLADALHNALSVRRQRRNG